MRDRTKETASKQRWRKRYPEKARALNRITKARYEAKKRPLGYVVRLNALNEIFFDMADLEIVNEYKILKTFRELYYEIIPDNEYYAVFRIKRSNFDKVPHEPEETI